MSRLPGFSHHFWFCLSLLLFLCPFHLHAEKDLPNILEPTLIDRTHQTISDRLTSTSRWFDDFFSDPRSDEETAGTLLRLRGTASLTEGEDVHFDGQFKAIVNLPNLERRFHLILSSEEDSLHDQILGDLRNDQELGKTGNDSSLALQFTQERTSSLSLIHRVELNLENGFNPQLRSRLRYSIPIARESLLNLTQAVFWENRDGFGEESRIDFNIPLTEKRLVRATTKGLLSETSQGLEWLAMLQYLGTLDHQQALSVGASMIGETRPENVLTKYNLFIKYRQRFLKEWLYFEVLPEVFWPRERDFTSTTALSLTLEIQFGD